MDNIILYLVNHLTMFIFITVILFLALIGYIVDEHDRKKGISMIDKPKEHEKDIHELAMSATNKSLNTAVADSVKNNNMGSSISGVEAPFISSAEKNKIVDLTGGSNNNMGNPM